MARHMILFGLGLALFATNVSADESPAMTATPITPPLTIMPAASGLTSPRDVTSAPRLGPGFEMARVVAATPITTPQLATAVDIAPRVFLAFDAVPASVVAPRIPSPSNAAIPTDARGARTIVGGATHDGDSQFAPRAADGPRPLPAPATYSMSFFGAAWNSNFSF